MLITVLLLQGLRGAAEALLEALVARGADIDVKDSHGNTPLHRAAWRGHDHIVTALLARDANSAAENDRSYTPYNIALFKGHKDVAATLMEARKYQTYGAHASLKVF